MYGALESVLVRVRFHILKSVRSSVLSSGKPLGHESPFELSQVQTGLWKKSRRDIHLTQVSALSLYKAVLQQSPRLSEEHLTACEQDVQMSPRSCLPSSHKAQAQSSATAVLESRVQRLWDESKGFPTRRGLFQRVLKRHGRHTREKERPPDRQETETEG